MFPCSSDMHVSSPVEIYACSSKSGGSTYITVSTQLPATDHLRVLSHVPRSIVEEHADRLAEHAETDPEQVVAEATGVRGLLRERALRLGSVRRRR